MADSRASAYDSLTAAALAVPCKLRGDWLLHLECDLTAVGKDGYLVAMTVGRALADLPWRREASRGR
jgi:hypothetical protein